MRNHYTQESFIEKARKVHGDKYDYSKVEYVNTNLKVCIICPKHGEFLISPSDHMRGRGCPQCGILSRSSKSKSNTEDFIEKAKAVHGDKYDYSKVEYINSKVKVCISCPEHGEFWQTPNDHLRGTECPKCAQIKCNNIEENSANFIAKAHNIHNDKYDYSKVNYINCDTKVCIICPEHGEFWQTPYNHSSGKGCPKCAHKKMWDSRGRITLSSFIEKAKTIHGDKYDYPLDQKYINNRTPIRIICPKHGEFLQTPNYHLNGRGCYYCGLESQVSQRTMPLTDFIQKANEAHDNKYDYSKVKYVNAVTKVCIICPEHGEFWQTPYSHLSGCGCPECANNGTSNPEKEINQFINEELNIETISNDRKLLNGLEVDILIPSHKLAIEYNGLYWHSESNGKDLHYHLNKTELAESKGYHLIQIFEDEWIEHKDIVLERITHILHCDKNKKVIGARKCNIKTIGKEQTKIFLDKYHIQGFVASSLYYAAYYQDELVGVMTFKEESKNMWNLTRFATNTNYSLPGLASKIFKRFIIDNNPSEIKTFLDRRWSHCNTNLYDNMGFKLAKIERPDYRYVVGLKREHKFGFRKQILNKKYGLPLTMTEKEMTSSLGISRIWDCGLYKYMWKNKNS